MISSAWQILSMACSFVAAILLAQAISPEDRGIIGWVMSFYMVGYYLGQAGIPGINKRIVAESKTLRPEVMALNVAGGTVGATIATLACLVVAQQSPTFTPYFYTLFALIPLGVLMFNLCNFALAKKEHKTFNVMLQSWRIIITILSFALFVTDQLTLQTYFIMFFCAMGTPCIYFAIKHKNDLIDLKWPSKKIRKSISSFMIVSYINDVLHNTNKRFGVIFLGFVGAIEDAAFLTIALTLVEAANALPMFISYYITPKLVNTKDLKKRKKIKIASLAGTFVIMAVGSALMALLAPFLVPLLFGADYAASVPFLLWLLPGLVMTGLYEISQASIASQKHFKRMVWPAVVTTTLCVSGSFWLYGQIGTVGVAAAWSFAITIGALLSIALQVTYKTSEKDLEELANAVLEHPTET